MPVKRGRRKVVKRGKRAAKRGKRKNPLVDKTRTKNAIEQRKWFPEEIDKIYTSCHEVVKEISEGYTKLRCAADKYQNYNGCQYLYKCKCLDTSPKLKPNETLDQLEKEKKFKRLYSILFPELHPVVYHHMTSGCVDHWKDDRATWKALVRKFQRGSSPSKLQINCQSSCAKCVCLCPPCHGEVHNRHQGKKDLPFAVSQVVFKIDITHRNKSKTELALTFNVNAKIYEFFTPEKLQMSYRFDLRPLKGARD